MISSFQTPHTRQGQTAHEQLAMIVGQDIVLSARATCSMHENLSSNYEHRRSCPAYTFKDGLSVRGCLGCHADIASGGLFKIDLLLLGWATKLAW